MDRRTFFFVLLMLWLSVLLTVVHAQPSAKIYRIGWLGHGSTPIDAAPGVGE
jgi:hypothetical protein